MRNVGRKLAFVLAASNHGTMILNRFDYQMTGPDEGVGVGHQILESAARDTMEVELGLQLLDLRRRYHGDGVVAIDCGANIGADAIEWATAMTGWGSVIAIEAQERLYYALAGNIAINNCFNAIAMHAAVSSEMGVMNIPTPDYLTAANFGGLALRKGERTESIGQDIDYSEDSLVAVQKVALDNLKLPRVDLIKFDIPGMELEALAGAREVLEKNRPVLLVKAIKAERETVRTWLAERGYKVVDAGHGLLAIHLTDATSTALRPDTPEAQSSAA